MMFLKRFIIIYLLIISSCLHADNIRILTLSFPPYAYVESGQVKGFVVDIVKEAMDRLQQDYELVVQPWARSLHEMKTGKGDGLFPMFITEDRIYFTEYSTKPLTYEYKSLFIRASDAIQYDGDLALLGDYRFCRVRGYSSGPVFDQAELNGTLPYVDLANSSLQNIQKILHNRCQILVDDRNVAAHLLKRLKQSNELSLLVDLERIPSYMGFSKFGKAKSLVKKFDKVHQGMLNDGTIDKILSDYLGDHSQSQ
ncbi:hypothetical protein B9G39_08580 [Zooshikella ganghwensis]|uniref:Solute-binding protein family 3/N-terminal domain-containing protein n=1 Tax=Zooshikella ganghwensis TaxID=202772 RepID=A0A4P9VN12_9GAMM|nr:hypothetical protein B9G39_08580 [Zooshikella ganghwensis]